MTDRRVLLTIVPLLLVGCRDSTGPAFGPPAQINVLEGAGQSAPAGTALPQPIRLRVEDASGRGIPDVGVTFTVTSGMGQLAQATDTTNAAGEVEVPRWTLGKFDLPQRVIVSISTAPGVTLEIAATVATQYKVELVFTGPPLSPTHRTAFELAAARLQAMITGDVFDVSVSGLSVQECAPSIDAFFGRQHTGVIDDLVIYVAVDSIDGPGKTLAFAGPCYARLDSPVVEAPLLGIMVFDSADVRNASAETMQAIVLHEMLHVVGFHPFFWARRNLVANPNTPAWSFTGDQARQRCAELGGAGVICNPFVPIENQAGGGTRGSHWRECELPTLGRELMTGFLSSGANPLSTITIGSMGDLGYQVNAAAADPFPIPEQVPLPSNFEGCFPASGETSTTTHWERLISPIAGVTRHGHVIPLQEPL